MINARLTQVWWPVLATLLGFLLLVLGYVLGPWPLWVRIANVGSRSFSVGWVTQKPVRGCIWVFEGEKIPTKLSVICDESAELTHLLTISRLKELHVYRVFVAQGWRVYPMALKTVQTYADKAYPPNPMPGYGTVADMSGERIPRALVYVYPTRTNSVYPEAVIANEQGNYAVDLGFNGEFFEWVIEGGSGPDQWDYKQVSGETTAPFPPLGVSKL